MSVSESIRTQSKISCYDLEKVIGKGNFAVVRLATHIPTRTKVAIKIIDMTRLDTENRKKVKREIEVMKQLDHPNVIKLYQVMQTSQWLYLVMEYASGGEIFEYLIQHRRMSENEARKKFRQIVMAVDYCHQKGVVHRDLKAENLLLDENSNVKLADFGFSNTFSQAEMLKTWCGSPPYAAPELFEGKEYSGPQADIWSLGVVLYVMVCGALPFDGNNLQHLRARVLAGRFRIPYYMSTECEKLIRRMLQLDPAKRIPLAKVLEHRWMLEGETTAQIPLIQAPQRSSSSNLMLNEKVMMAIQRLNFNAELVKESVEKKLYNEFSALYYILLHKCEKGQLHIAPPLSTFPHHRYSLPAAIPLISVIGTTESQSPGSTNEMPTVSTNQWNALNLPSTTGSSSILDPNLARYLNQGRRHTLGPEHHLALQNLQEDLPTLRKINESSSSQASSGFGSSCTNPPIHPETSLAPPLVINGEHSLQSSVNSLSSSSRQFLHLRNSTQRFNRRRASDGGPHAAMFKLLHQHVQIQPSDGSGASIGPNIAGAPSTVKHLQEKEVLRKNTLPAYTHKQWLQVKNQLSYRQLWSVKAGMGPNTLNPQQVPSLGQVNMASMDSNSAANMSLQKQLQPFQDISPQQIQEQLQHLHLQRRDFTGMDYMEHKEMPSASGIGSTGAVGSSGLGSSGGDESSSSSLNSSTSHSRKSSGSSLLHQYLLSPPTPPSNTSHLSISPQSVGISSAIYGNEQTGPRRFSVQGPTPAPLPFLPKHAHRNTLPDLFPTRGTRFPGLPTIELPSHSQTLPGIPPSPRSPQPDGFSPCSSPENSSPLLQQLMQAEAPSMSRGRQGSPKRLTPSPTLGLEGRRSPSPNTLQRRRRAGVSLTHHEQAEVKATIDQFPVPGSQLPFMAISHPPILLNNFSGDSTGLQQGTSPSGFQPVQNIPIYFNQNISFLNPQVANQIAQQQVAELVTHISAVLKNLQLSHECTNNVFTVSHQGVEMQIRVGGTPHNILQTALQLNLQYMYISGDPNLYQALCAQLAPHFIPNMQQQ